MTDVTPSVDLTIFPRINYLKNFEARAIQRNLNGRIYGIYGIPPIDHLPLFPDVDGSTCISQETFDLDLQDGGTITTVPTSVIDLRNDCGTASVIDLNQSSPTGAVTITGTVRVDQTLTANTSTIADVDGLGAFSYQWSADNAVISGATNSSYTLTQAEVGKTITVTVSYTDLAGTFESLTSTATSTVANVNNSPVGSVTINGTPEEDQTLFAITTTIADADGLGTFSYQWSADGSAVSGATSNSYLLTQADVGKAFTVTVSYTDGGGTLESLTSTATSAVANVNDPPVGSVTITGTTTEGQTLTASASITDEDGIGTFSYQWKADGVAISGATNTTYVLTATETGKQITCTVSYTDGQGTAESLTSAATVAIAGVAAHIQYTMRSGTFFKLLSTGTVNYTVDWGDGNTQTSTSNSLSHWYSSASSYVITVTPTGTYRPNWDNSSHADKIAVCEISTDSGWNLGSSLKDAFEGAAYMTTITMNFSATSNVTSLFRAWEDCFDLTSFPLIDTSNVISFQEAWENNRDLTSFPLLDTSSATGFLAAWSGCSSLTTFPANMFDSTGTLSSFVNAWYGCALTAQSIENILTSLDTNGQSNISVSMNGGTNAAKSTWSTAANTAYTNLTNKGWNISYNT